MPLRDATCEFEGKLPGLRYRASRPGKMPPADRPGMLWSFMRPCGGRTNSGLVRKLQQVDNVHAYSQPHQFNVSGDAQFFLDLVVAI